VGGSWERSWHSWAAEPSCLVRWLTSRSASCIWKFQDDKSIKTSLNFSLIKFVRSSNEGGCKRLKFREPSFRRELQKKAIGRKQTFSTAYEHKITLFNQTPGTSDSEHAENLRIVNLYYSS
jgi:hypothetical protein